MPEPAYPSRRRFIKQASFLGAAAATFPAVSKAFETHLNDQEEKEEGYTILFQGDSITDGNRSRNMDWNHVLGHGYAYLIAARLWYDLPQKKFHFFNRGISGNKVTDLTERWQDDTIALKPDLLSILIGVNDANMAIDGDKSFTFKRYEDGYRALLAQTQQKLPETTFVLCEPFILPVGKVKERWNDYETEIIARQQIVKKLAAEFNAIHVPLQVGFNKAALKYPPAGYWMWDGIHPMPNGHELIAREWIKQVSKKVKAIR